MRVDPSAEEGKGGEAPGGTILAAPFCRVLALALACGCAVPDGTATTEEPLVGGVLTQGYPAVLYLWNPDGGYCSGSLIAPNVVLTAAHCQIQVGGTARTMAIDQTVSVHDIVEVVTHRRHDGGDDFSHNDVALARLADEPAVDPLPFRTAALPEVVGDALTVVGFGVVDGDTDTGGGVKRTAIFTVDLQIRDYLAGSAPGTSICYGDSGGPAFMTFDDVETVVGITRSHFNNCTGDSQWTRVDTYAAEFIVPYVDAWYGPCRLDGACVEEGCRTPDPDCAPCGIDHVCSAGCPEVDLDCPLGELFGGECASPDDCESRLCIEDAREPGMSFCSQPCDGPDSFCPQGAVCTENADGWRCEYVPEDTPSDEEGGGCAVIRDGHSESSMGLILLVLLTVGRARRRP